MENTINNTDLLEQTGPEVVASEAQQEPIAEEAVQSEESVDAPSKETDSKDGYISLPPGALADIKRKQREAGRRDRDFELQRELEALQRQQEVTDASSQVPQSQPKTVSSYTTQDFNHIKQEADNIDYRGSVKYPGTKFDPKTGDLVGSFKSVVVDTANRDPFAGQVALEILKSDFPIGKEDVLYKVFSDQNFLEDLRYMNPQGVRMKVQKYIWNSNQQKPKPAARPSNPPLSEIKSSANTKQTDKKLSIREKLAILEGRSKR